MDAPTLEAAADAQKPLVETEWSKREGLGAIRRIDGDARHQLAELKTIDAEQGADLFVHLSRK